MMREPDGAQRGGEPQLSLQSWQVKKKSFNFAAEETSTRVAEKP